MSFDQDDREAKKVLLKYNLDDIFDSKPPPMGLETQEYRQSCHEMVEYIIGYYEKLKTLKPIPDVEPGFMRAMLNDAMPEEKESWQTVFKDLDDVVMKGMTHWHSPGFFAFFSTATSYPAMLGDMLSTAVACVGFTWASSPSCTELETVVMDWLAKALDLPKTFIHNGTGPGAGVIQGSASEATLVTLLAARKKTIRKELSKNPNQSVHEIASKMVAYTSECSHSSVERAGLIALVNLKTLDVDSNASLRGSTLIKAIEEDRAHGKIPFYVCATSGTTVCCSFDNIEELGTICEQESIWLHVDAAYAGAALICPEYRCICQGLEKATSFVFNPHKWLMVNFDCSALWVKDSNDLVNSLHVNPLFLQHEAQGSVIDYMHWEIPLGRRFRSIKLWFVLRMVGMEGLRHHVRKGVAEAKHLEKLIKDDSRFEILYPVHLGLVCFRLTKPGSTLQELNEINKTLCKKINSDRRLFISPSTVNGVFFLRVSMGSIHSSIERVNKCWEVIQEMANSFSSME